MSRIIIILSIAIILFVGAAGLSWYLQPRPQDPDAGNKEGEEKVAKAPAKKAGASKSDGTETKPGKTFPNNPEANRAAQMLATIQQREETIKQREQHLLTREKQLTAIHDEIKKEHTKLELVRKEVQLELNNVKQKLDQIELRTADASKEKKDILAGLEKLQLLGNNVKQNEAKNARQNAMIFDKMEPDAASTMLNQMVESGKADEAAIILSFMKQSQAAAVYAEITKQDPAVATKLFDRMQQIQITAEKK